ncbi:hypothetical protein CLOM_g14530 [Closterium sp. NIES-68]|nr:hypothetical protein CLOM_g14530 [Closterium sp. NIES-68]
MRLLSWAEPRLTGCVLSGTQSFLGSESDCDDSMSRRSPSVCPGGCVRRLAVSPSARNLTFQSDASAEPQTLLR